MSIQVLERRQLVNILGAVALTTIPNCAIAKTGVFLPTTPKQTQGPFYPDVPIEEQTFNDTNLLRKVPMGDYAKGQPIVLRGTVRNRRGAALNGCVVEIWQACASGRYCHADDRNNPATLDNNFQFWGRAVTGPDGKYSFLTIIPGLHPSRNARHIHFRIDSPKHSQLHTQCYFADFAKENKGDASYRELNRKQRHLLTVKLDKSPKKPKQPSDAASAEKVARQNERPRKKAWRGRFDIVLSRS